MDRKSGIILLAVALVIILALIFSNKAKASAPAANNTVTPPKTNSGPIGKKAYAISNFRTLYDLNNNTVKNLMKDEYVGLVTKEVPADEINPLEYEIDSKYLIPEVFVYLK